LQLTAHAAGTFEIPSRSNTAGILLVRRNRDMPTLSNGPLRKGLALKLGHIKLATRAYLRDRTRQATSTVTGYAIAAGSFSVAGVFLIAACLVGAAALFRWIEVRCCLFPAFGAIGALAVAAVCVALAVGFLRRPSPQFPSLNSRLRVAIRANPIRSDARDYSASATLLAPTASVRRTNIGPRPGPTSHQISAGLLVIATLLGWAAARRWQQARNAATLDP
jgi:hypothetical protein